jgi:hypothetical protein
MVKRKGVKRYKPEWRRTGTTRWQGFPNVGSYGDRKLAEKFVRNTRKSFKEVGRRGRFRIRVIYV